MTSLREDTPAEMVDVTKNVAELSQAVDDNNHDVAELKQAVTDTKEDVAELSQAVNDNKEDIADINQAIGEAKAIACGLTQDNNCNDDKNPGMHITGTVLAVLANVAVDRVVQLYQGVRSSAENVQLSR
jgi:hypothetical protein